MLGWKNSTKKEKKKKERERENKIKDLNSLSTVTRICNCSTWEGDAGRSGVQGNPQLHRKFNPGLCKTLYESLSIKNNKQKAPKIPKPSILKFIECMLGK